MRARSARTRSKMAAKGTSGSALCRRTGQGIPNHERGIGGESRGKSGTNFS